MKQKVGLCGALVHDPDLLILDEPTTGVDPLSRRQFWALIDDIRASRPGMSVVISTAYMDEAQRWDWIVAMDAGRVLATGTPAELMAADADAGPRAVLHRPAAGGEAQGAQGADDPAARASQRRDRHRGARTSPCASAASPPSTTCQLSIERGEIFGFLGSNGCGKSTTMKMLTGLLPPTEGTATLFGSSVEAGSMEVRKNLGYMTQAFSLYGELTVRKNLVLHARLYHLPPEKAEARIEELVDRFGLESHLDALAGALPMGLKQRLSLAVAVLHEPEILILDEPTSGVDPVARDSFWELLIDLSREQGVTIFVTTHFMNEGMRCDRISLMHAGKVLACDAPDEADRGAPRRQPRGRLHRLHGGRDRARRRMGTARGRPASPLAEPGPAPAPAAAVSPATAPSRLALSFGRMLAYARNETDADPPRPGAPGLRLRRLGAADARLRLRHHHRRRAHPLRGVRSRPDRPRAARYLEQFAGSQRYFANDRAGHLRRGGARAPAVGRRLAGARDPAQLRPEPPPGLGARGPGPGGRRHDLPGRHRRAVRPGGARDLLQGSRRPGSALPAPSKYSADIEERYMYNPTFESIYSIVPSVPALLLLLIPAILMTVSIVREKELGSIINFYVTPTGRLEYLLGKQLPYVAIGMINFFILTLLALLVFRRPDQGQLPDADALHAALRHGDDRHRHGHLDLHQQPGRGGLRHGDPDHHADDPVLGPAAAGLDAARGARGSSARSGRPPTTCTPASAPTPRGWAAT